MACMVYAHITLNKTNINKTNIGDHLIGDIVFRWMSHFIREKYKSTILKVGRGRRVVTYNVFHLGEGFVQLKRL